MGLQWAGRIGLLRDRAAELAAPRGRQRCGRGEAGAGVGRRPRAARSEAVPAAGRAGEVQGDPDGDDRQVGGARAAREVRPGPVRAALRRRRAGRQDRGQRRARRAGAQGGRTIDRAPEERGRPAAARSLEGQDDRGRRPQRRAVPPGRLQRRSEALHRRPARHQGRGRQRGEGDVGARLRDHARVRLVGRQGRDADARGGPQDDRRRGRGRAQGGRGGAGAGRQRADARARRGRRTTWAIGPAWICRGVRTIWRARSSRSGSRPSRCC